MINIGDDVTISGKVVDVVNYGDEFGKGQSIIIETSRKHRIWVSDKDVKTHIPNTKEDEHLDDDCFDVGFLKYIRDIV